MERLAAPALKVCPCAGAINMASKIISSSLIVKLENVKIGKCGNVKIGKCENWNL
jgi:hypothetical protein